MEGGHEFLVRTFRSSVEVRLLCNLRVFEPTQVLLDCVSKSMVLYY